MKWDDLLSDLGFVLLMLIIVCIWGYLIFEL